MGSQCLTQNSQSIIGCKIDTDLAATQTMMGVLNNIDTADDEHLENKLTEARWFAGIGTAGPAIVAGTMLIMFRIAMALFVGFAPVFILCLLFKKTAPLFQKWLYYGLSTIFSGVMLGVMSDISMDLVTNLGITDAVSSFTGVILTGQSATGIMQTVTQQLGLGLMLSTLLITVPPMAGMFFNGVMGSYSGYNAMAGWTGGQPATPPGHNSYSQQVEQRVSEVRPNITSSRQTNANNSQDSNVPKWSVNQLASGSNNGTQSTDQIRQQSQMGQAQTTINAVNQQVSNNLKQEGNTDKIKTNKGENI